MTDLAKVLASRKSEIIDTMVRVIPPSSGATENDVRQFVGGFVHLVEQGARGNMQPREDYLQTVIPGVKKAGMPLSTLMVGMVQTSLVLAACLGPEHARWLNDFCGTYTLDMLKAWDAV